MLSLDAGKASLHSKHPESETHDVCDELEHNSTESFTNLDKCVPSKAIVSTRSTTIMKAGEIKKTLLSKPPAIKFSYRETLMSFTNLAPVLPSRSSFLLQDLEDKLPMNNSKGCLQIREEQHMVYDPGANDVPNPLESKANTKTKPCDIQHKAGKGVVVADATTPRYAFLFIPEAKSLEFEHIKEHYLSKDKFRNLFLCYEDFELKQFLRHENNSCKPSNSLKDSVLMNIDKFSKIASVTPINLDKFYCDSTLNLDKNLDEHAELLNFVLGDLSNKECASHKEYVRCTYNILFQVFKSVQVIQEEGIVVFELGYKFWNRMKEKRFPARKKLKPMLRIDCLLRVKEQINAYKICLQGEYNLSFMFSFSNLISFLADCSDLRSNPFQEGGNDMILTSTKKDQLEPVHDTELVAEEADVSMDVEKEIELECVPEIEPDMIMDVEKEFEAEEHAAEKPLIIPKCSTIQKQETTSTPTQDG